MKYKQDIENELFYASEHMKGFMDYEGRLNELDEVYCKAKAFDEIAEALPGYREIILNKTGMSSTYDYMTFGNFASEVILNYESEETE